MRLKKLRISHGLKQKDLGHIVGMTEGAISRLESGERSPSIEVAVALSQFFNVSLDYFLGSSDSPNRVHKPEHGVENINLQEKATSLKETEIKYKHKTSTKLVQAEKGDQANKKFGQSEIEELMEELDEESIAELRKYAKYLKIRQTLDSDESSAGLDGKENKKENQRGVK